MAGENTTLDAAVNAAVETVGEDGNKGTAPTETVETIETTEVATEAQPTETTEEVEIEATVDEINSGLTLLRTMQDPQKRDEFIAALLKGSGVKTETKAEVAQVKRDLKAILKEKLGDNNYELVAGDLLSEALDAIIAGEIDAKVKPLQDKLNETTAAHHKRQADEAMDKFFTKNKIEKSAREAVADKMLRKMQVMPATANANVDDYLDDIYTLVKGSGETSKAGVAKTIAKITKNAKEATKVSGESAGVGETTVKVGARLLTLDEAVRLAVAGKRRE